jgi:hypothetical protein
VACQVAACLTDIAVTGLAAEAGRRLTREGHPLPDVRPESNTMDRSMFSFLKYFRRKIGEMIGGFRLKLLLFMQTKMFITSTFMKSINAYPENSGKSPKILIITLTPDDGS